MEDNFFVWDQHCNSLILKGTSKVEEEQKKEHTKLSFTSTTFDSKIYCPHSYLILRFQESLSPSEKIKFRKHYLRKVSPTETNVIILQDIKDLAMYLLISPLSTEFIKFFHLSIVDRFLRTLIVYFQHYIKIWEVLMQEQVARRRKIPYSFDSGQKVKYITELKILRCILGKVYSDLILGCDDGKYYRNLMSAQKQTTTLNQSQGQIDLRIFEVLINLTQRVIWIALQRTHFNLIEMELHRLFRSDAFNTAERLSDTKIFSNMLASDIQILHGTKSQFSKRKLLKNSPLIEELLHTDCNYLIMFLGVVDIHTSDPYINYLQNALLAKEDMLLQIGISVGILGRSRSDFDIMLTPSEEEKHIVSETYKQIIGTKHKDKNNTILNEDQQNWHEGEKQVRKMSIIKPDTDDVPRTYSTSISESFFMSKDYKNVIQNARIKWIKRVVNRRETKQSDTFSIATTADNK